MGARGRVRRHKFGAKPTHYNGRRYASKLEASYAWQLETLKTAGDVLFWLEQVPFHLPGGTKYVCDFQVFYASGEVRFVDVKGFETPEFKLKKRLVEALYPVEIELWTRKGATNATVGKTD